MFSSTEQGHINGISYAIYIFERNTYFKLACEQHRCICKYQSSLNACQILLEIHKCFERIMNDASLEKGV